MRVWTPTRLYSSEIYLRGVGSKYLCFSIAYNVASFDCFSISFFQMPCIELAAKPPCADEAWRCLSRTKANLSRTRLRARKAAAMVCLPLNSVPWTTSPSSPRFADDNYSDIVVCATVSVERGDEPAVRRICTQHAHTECVTHLVVRSLQLPSFHEIATMTVGRIAPHQELRCAQHVSFRISWPFFTHFSGPTQ